MEKKDEHKEITLDDLARMMAAGFAETRERIDSTVGELRHEMNERLSTVDKRLDSLTYKVDQLDAKAERYHQETKGDLASLRAIVGAQSHTLTDHEERIKVLEGE